MKVIIVDDEPLAQEILESFIAKFANLDLVSKCNNAIEAFDILNNQAIDLMFVDINMPQITGIEMVKTLQNPPMIVFTTAHEKYALDGYEVNALDYLLKPISFDRFTKAIHKAQAKYALSQKSDILEEHAEYIFIKSDKKLVKVNYADILYVEGLKDYVIIKTDSFRVITLQTMKSLEEKLPSGTFKRVHRSYIINLNKIQAMLGHAIEIMEKNIPKHIPIGKNYRDEIVQLIEDKKL